MINNSTVEKISELIRKSHCAQGYAVHSCQGVCILKPGGVELQCERCGDGGSSIEATPNYRTLRLVFDVIGLDIRQITETSILKMLDILNGVKD